MSFVVPMSITVPRALGIDPSLTADEVRRFVYPVTVPHKFLMAAKEAGHFDCAVGEYIQNCVIAMVERAVEARSPSGTRTDAYKWHGAAAPDTRSPVQRWRDLAEKQKAGYRRFQAAQDKTWGVGAPKRGDA